MFLIVTDVLQRVLFGVQTPLAMVAGVGVFFSIPKSFTGGPKSVEEQTTFQKLMKIDYIGGVSLVSHIHLYSYLC